MLRDPPHLSCPLAPGLGAGLCGFCISIYPQESVGKVWTETGRSRMKMRTRSPLPGEHLGSALAGDQQPREANPTTTPRTRRPWDRRPGGPSCGPQHASGDGVLLLPHSQETPLLGRPRSILSRGFGLPSPGPRSSLLHCSLCR